jgi:heme exporter protein C
MKQTWFYYASPANFYALAGRLITLFTILAAILILFGLYWGFFQTPNQLGGMNSQKEYYRIIFLHVPAAWMSMWLYVVVTFWSTVGLIYNTNLSFMMARAVAPTGAIFTFLALWSGSFWGRISWGTWWDWDPRLTSELILFFLYGGYLALHSAIDDTRRADRAASLLAIVGLVCVPIIFWSINCPDPNQCSSLHQRSGLGHIDPNIKKGMLLVTFGFLNYSIAASLMRVRSIILERNLDKKWVHELPDLSNYLVESKR